MVRMGIAAVLAAASTAVAAAPAAVAAAPAAVAAAPAAVAAARVAPAMAAAPPGAPAFPLARGEVAVALGMSPGQWQPQAGAPLALTLLAGPPPGSVSAPRRLTAFAALQRSDRPCAGSARADRATLVAFPGFYGAPDRVAAGSPLASAAGAAYAASASAGVLTDRGAVRACVWLADSPAARARPTAEVLPLLNGLFAAAVWPAAGGYAFDAGAVGTPFSYAVTSDICGQPRTESSGTAQEIGGTVSVGTLDCPGDAWLLRFSRAGGSPFGSISYSDAQALASPPVYAQLGGCDLSGVAGLSVADARRYVAAVGCRVAGVLRAAAGGSRTAVGEAEVDGGEATLAPAGTAVDLVTG